MVNKFFILHFQRFIILHFLVYRLLTPKPTPHGPPPSGGVGGGFLLGELEETSFWGARGGFLKTQKPPPTPHL